MLYDVDGGFGTLREVNSVILTWKLIKLYMIE